MKITNSSIKDIPEIFRLYKIATEYQLKRNLVPWPEFDVNLIEKEIRENRQWKIIINNAIACIWATTFDDPLIWGVKNEDPSVYIHRIATNPEFKGRKLVFEIAAWAKNFAIQNNKNFIRMDTVGENISLIEHYRSCGFTFLGLFKLNHTEGLPQHYTNATVSLFELRLI